MWPFVLCLHSSTVLAAACVLSLLSLPIGPAAASPPAETAARIVVVGAVVHPGPVDAATDADLYQVLLSVGGLLPNHWFGQAVVVRETSGRLELVPVPAYRPFAFRDGDVLCVPRTGQSAASAPPSGRAAELSRGTGVVLGSGKRLYQPSPRADGPDAPARPVISPG